MHTFRYNKIIQFAAWLIFYIFLTAYSLQKWEHPAYSIWASTIATASYCVAVYGNALYLVPLWQTNKRSFYFFYASGFLLAVIFLRMWVENIVLMPLHHTFYNWSVPHIAFTVITVSLAFAFGAFLKITLNHFTLLKKQQLATQQKLLSELNLLKSQLQPHFLFNTLNNIYSLIFISQEEAALALAKLSGIMRYFVDDVPNERVPIQRELQFIKDYIALEGIRMPYPIQVQWKVDIDGQEMIPPMLFTPFIENIYKHGIDKMSKENKVTISIQQKDGQLAFQTSNNIQEKTDEKVRA